jgi:hypothetical protein
MRIKGFAFVGLAAASAMPVGKEFAKNYFWDRVLHFMSPILEPIGLWIIDYGPAVVFLIAGFYVTTTGAERAAARKRIERSVNLYLLVAGIGAVTLLGGLVGAWWDYRRGPVIFTWNLSSPINIGGSGNVYYIGSFSIGGENRWDEPITKIKASIRSNIDGRVPLFFVKNQLIDPAKVVVPPHQKFFLAANAKPDGAGTMSFDEFYRDFGSFTFVFQHDDAEPIKVYFSESNVRKIVEDATANVKNAMESVMKNMQPAGSGIIVRD